MLWFIYYQTPLRQKRLGAAELAYIERDNQGPVNEVAEVHGKQQGKTDYLQSIRDGKSVYDKIDVESLHVRAYNGGTAAAVNGQLTIYQPNKSDGTPNVAHLKYVTVQ